MKKIFKGLLLFLLVLFPAIVKADMSAPSLLEYEATVISENGADCYDYSGDYHVASHLEKGEKVTVRYEMDEDGITYFGINADNDECHYVQSKDLMPTNEIVDLNNQNVVKLDSASKFLVYADEVEVRKGPSVSYEVVGKLKKGTIGNYLYEIIESSYIYVEANGIKGWVDTIDKKVLTPSSQFILGDDFESDCGIIPANTIIKDGWDTSKWDMSTLVNYNGCETFIRTFKEKYIVPLIEPKQTKTSQELTIYETATAQKEISKIPAGEQIKVLSYAAANSHPTENDKAYSYVEYGDIKGWVLYKASYWDWEDSTSNFEDEVYGDNVLLDPEYTVEEEEKSETIGEIEPVASDKKINTFDLIIMCVVVAFAVALGAIITLVLVNKKKKVEP